METIRDAIKYVSDRLLVSSPTARLDAELLVAQATTHSRTQLWVQDQQRLNVVQQKTILNAMHRRLKGEPIAYILGYREFWSLRLQVTPDVLIPRPETEMLVEWILSHLPTNEMMHIADLGTGSGAIALALAHERPLWQIDATDASEKALAIAKKNAQQLGYHQVHFYRGNWCAALPQQNYDLIVSNPPYIKNNDPHLLPLRYEPSKALIAGHDGLSALNTIVSEACTYLKPGGYLVLEHGFNQATALHSAMHAHHYMNIVNYRDLSHWPRMMVAQKPNYLD